MGALPVARASFERLFMVQAVVAVEQPPEQTALAIHLVEVVLAAAVLE